MAANTLIKLFASLQNAMRAVVEFHRDKMELPKLKIIVAKGQQDLTIKVFKILKQRKQLLIFPHLMPEMFMFNPDELNEKCLYFIICEK